VGLLFAPDPTSEEESTIGGAIACNASGARSFRYGATRQHVQAITVLLASGERLDLRRPALEKNTVGYPIAQDPVDWFVGSEGTLGVVVEAELSLVPLPEQVVGLAIPFASEAHALAFIVAARETATGGSASLDLRDAASRTAIAPRCLEFFDERAVDVLRESDRQAPWDSEVRAIVYTEDAGDHRHDGDAALDAWLALAEAHDALVGDIRVYDGAAALADARRLRHAVPSTMNARGAACRANGGRKVSTDWAVPYRRLGEALQVAHTLADAAGIERSVTYGHAGNGHPHQNFIARDADELARLEPVLRDTLARVIAMGGTVAAEHGIGKLKRKWLPMQMCEAQRRVMQALKHALDPHGLMAPGNVL
jgi:FAD/FMN-containing dehydrogenase